MEQAVIALITILKQIIVILDEYLALSETKKNALVKNDTKVINEIIKSELELNAKMSNLEKVRQEILKKISKDDTSLSSIIDGLSGNLKKQLEACHNTIKDKLHLLQSANKINVELINNNLSYVDFMMNNLTGSQKRSTVYTPNGYSQNKPKGRALFENKV